MTKLQSMQIKNWARLGGLCLSVFAVVVICAGLFRTGIFSGVVGAQEEAAPKYKVDASWPKPLPNKWKMGGVTGLAVDKDDNVWVYDRPNDLTSIEIEAELDPPIADCCVHPPSMIHIAGHDGPGYKDGDVIGYFDAQQGHGMAVDKKGFVYLGQNTVRKYDPKTGKMLMAVPHVRRRPMASRSTIRPSQSQAGRGQRRACGRLHHRAWRSAQRSRRCRRGGRHAGRVAEHGLHRQVSADHPDDHRRNRRGPHRR